MNKKEAKQIMDNFPKTSCKEKTEEEWANIYKALSVYMSIPIEDAKKIPMAEEVDGKTIVWVYFPNDTPRIIHSDYK